MRRSRPAPTALDIASDSLYAAFNRYQGTHLEGCPHCVSFEDSAALRRTPLRRLGRELDRYLFKAMTTWGTDDDFKYFVPRLLELYPSSSDGWLLCDKLAYARWRSWPISEQHAVENYLRTVWHDELATIGPPLPGHPLLETLLTLELDIRPYDPCAKLEAWRSQPSRDSAQCLAQFVLEHGPALVWPSLSDGRLKAWQSQPEIADEVEAWLFEPATRAMLEAMFFAHNDRDVARAFDWLESTAQRR